MLKVINFLLSLSPTPGQFSVIKIDRLVTTSRVIAVHIRGLTLYRTAGMIVPSNNTNKH